jgi:acyl-coenzyme A thioesterase PaaI-like protein
MIKERMHEFPGKGWTPIMPFAFVAGQKSDKGPTSGGDLVGLDYYRRPDASLAAVATFGRGSEGAPGQAHGGMILTVLDEALGAAAWHAGHPVLTVRLSAEFRVSVPVRARMLVETRISAVRRRKVYVEGALLGADGRRYASAHGEFLVLGEAAQRRIFGRTFKREEP